MEDHIYNLDNVKQIMQTGFSYLLSNEIVKHIQKIEMELGMVNTHIKSYDSNRPSHTTTHNHNDRPRSVISNRYKKEEVSWENVRNFKTTKIDKKEGLEKKINDIRICINKMSSKNYETQRDTILAFILQINTEDMDTDTEIELEKIALVIFDIASTNKFYSEMYAKLYRELIVLYPVFQKVLDDFLQTYIQSMQDIRYADPNVDYDLFCTYTKQSDKRKATAQFLVHMMREKILSQEYIVSLIDTLIQKVREYMEIQGKVNEVEEITELVNIFISQSKDTIVSNEIWLQCIEQIRSFSLYKLKEKASLSSRIIFKYIDLVSFIDKK